MELIIHSLADLPFVAKQFIEQLGNRKIVAFDAEMGAGKTTFINAILRAMGIDEPDGSPTYGIVNRYDTQYFGTVFHFDVYRLESIEEALDIGMEEMLYSDSYCFVEWPTIVEELLPEETVWVKIRVNKEEERIVWMPEEK